MRPETGDTRVAGGLPRILLVSRAFDPVGTGRQLELVASGLRGDGWEVHLAETTAPRLRFGSDGDRPIPRVRAAAGTAVLERLVAAGVVVHTVASRPIMDAAVFGRLVRLARRLRPDVLVAWGRSQLTTVAALRPWVPRSQLVGQVAAPLHGRVATWASRRLDMLIASSAEVAATCGTGPVEVIPPGIPRDTGQGCQRQELAARLGLDPAKAWTLCAAPLTTESRLDRLIWAIDQLGVVHHGVQHVLVGDGPLRAMLERRARAHQIADRLVMPGQCPYVSDLIGQVRLVWHSGEVAHGGALLDGMARGVPAVAVESSAARQLVVDGETGRVVPPVPASELPRRALAILEDDALAARWGAAASARAAEAFCIAAMQTRFAEVLARVTMPTRKSVAR